MPTQFPRPVPHFVAFRTGKLLLALGFASPFPPAAAAARRLLDRISRISLQSDDYAVVSGLDGVAALVEAAFVLNVGPDVIGKLVGWGAPLKTLLFRGCRRRRGRTLDFRR